MDTALMHGIVFEGIGRPVAGRRTGRKRCFTLCMR